LIKLIDPDAGNKMTDQELKDLVASLAISQAATDAQMAKTDAQMAKTDAQLARTDKKFKTMQSMLDGISKNQGSVAEEFFYNSLKSKPIVGAVSFDQITPNLIVGRKGKESEFDVVLVNGSSVALIEVKYKAHVNDLAQVHEQIKRFRRDCTQYKDYALYGGIAGLSVPNEVSKAAKAQGLFVLKRKGELLETQAEGMTAF
jgi:hypothetical protein